MFREKVPVIKEPYEDIVNNHYQYETIISQLMESKYCKLSTDEEYFIKYLLYKLYLNKEKGAVQLRRMSTRTIDFYYEGFPVGKIKLNGKKTSMQILLNLYDYHVLKDATLEEYIDEIDSWIRYIKKQKNI